MVSFQIPGATQEAESNATTAPLIVLFERDDGVAVPLLSQLRLAGYDVRAARTPVELFDTLGKQLASLVLVDLGNATAGRREFWVALDTQRRGKAIQVMTFRYVQPGGILDMDFDAPAKALADVEVHGAHEFQLLVEGVRQRVPLHGVAGMTPPALGAHPGLPGGIAPIGAALGVPSPFMQGGDPAGMIPPHSPGAFQNPYGNGFDPTSALNRGGSPAMPWQDPQGAFQPSYPQPGFMAPGGLPADYHQQPALQSGWIDPHAGRRPQSGFMGFESPFANPAQANPYGAEQSPFAQPYSMNPFADPAFAGPDSDPSTDPYGGMSSIPSTPGGSDPWASSFDNGFSAQAFNPFGAQQAQFFGPASAPSVSAFPSTPSQAAYPPFAHNGMFAPEQPQAPQRQSPQPIADAWIPPESDLEGETGVVPEMAYRPVAGRPEAERDRWSEPDHLQWGEPARTDVYDLPTGAPVRTEQEITARIPTPSRLPAVRQPTQTEKALSSVLVEGALLTEQRLDALKGIQQMLSSVDMNFKLGELALLFKFLSPDQLLAALLVSRGLVSPQQIAGLGRVKQELAGSGMDYDLETLLTMFHILPVEQLRKLRAELS